MGEVRRRGEGGRLRNPRGRLSLGREVGGTPVFWCSGVRGHLGDGVRGHLEDGVGEHGLDDVEEY